MKWDCVSAFLSFSSSPSPFGFLVCSSDTGAWRQLTESSVRVGRTKCPFWALGYTSTLSRIQQMSFIDLSTSTFHYPLLRWGLWAMEQTHTLEGKLQRQMPFTELHFLSSATSANLNCHGNALGERQPLSYAGPKPCRYVNRSNSAFALKMSMSFNFKLLVLSRVLDLFIHTAYLPH